MTLNSTLTLSDARPEHSGNYTCQPENAVGASIQIFVSEGEDELQRCRGQAVTISPSLFLCVTDRLSEPLLRPDLHSGGGGGGGGGGDVLNLPSGVHVSSSSSSLSPPSSISASVVLAIIPLLSVLSPPTYYYWSLS